MRVFVYIIPLMLPQIMLALDPSVITHNPGNIFYVNPLYGQVRLKAQPGTIAEAQCIINEQMNIMPLMYTDENGDYFVMTGRPFDTTASYYFIVKDATDSLRYPESYDFTPRAVHFNVPKWACGAVYYSIFTDGFSNGDVGNDPGQKALWGTPPKEWYHFGGDFKGIVRKIPYIESLGVGAVLLQPVFPAPSNHKLNPSRYNMIDPSFGDTVLFKQLIDEFHTRNIKVVLSIPVTHTGTEFPIFADIVKNGRESKYVNWYRVNTLPVTTSPPSYDCWRKDPHFPKLDLSNNQVVNFVIGYIDYWKHFGVDGFYIGEDTDMPASFVTNLRSYMKIKYEDCLLLGSDPRHFSGHGFDGSLLTTIGNLLIAYFIKNSITTSDFDRALSRLLFFNPPQANQVSLVTASTVNKRIAGHAGPVPLRNLYTFLLTYVGSPVIMYGDEVGMSQAEPLNLGSFPWNEDGQNRVLLEEIKQLIRIRNTYSQITSSVVYTLYINDITRVYAYDRGGFITVLNNGSNASFVELPAWDGKYLDIIRGDTLVAYSQALRLSVEPRSYRILKRGL
jgi:cyclomaltodextrinase